MSKAWTITHSSEERKILRRIFGPIYENDRIDIKT
jgi:hypothetical protein